MGKDIFNFGKIPFTAVVRKHTSDNRESPQLTTTTHGEVSGPLEHKLKRTGRTDREGGRRKGWSQTNGV